MTQDVSDAFVAQYESEAHEAYQRQGSRLRNTVRNKTNVVGSTDTFQKTGKGTASTKTRHGKVPVMNVSHDPVTCTLSDHYAGDWVDKLDEQKITIDERQVLSNAGAWAIGRKTDEIIFDALGGATQQSAAGGAGMTLAKFLEAIRTLGDNDVPMDDGQMYLPVGWQEWTDLLQIDEFSHADYVSSEHLPFRGRGFLAKWWHGVMVFPHSGVPVTAGDISSCFMYHTSAIGHCAGVELTADITWHGDYASHFINHFMSQGAVLIDVLGVHEILCDRSP
tara:strand:- start:1624 stop:2457 length:834 start_codon:yes stop_codon:yes gene_type:complete